VRMAGAIRGIHPITYEGLRLSWPRLAAWGSRMGEGLLPCWGLPPQDLIRCDGTADRAQDHAIERKTTCFGSGIVTDNRSTYGIELEKQMRRAERDEKRAARRSKTYTAADLRDQYNVDSETECWMWIGEFRSYTGESREIPIVRGYGVHQVCGTAHNAMSRPIYEEWSGRVLANDENVVGTCASNRRAHRHACVNPAHHQIRHGAGIFFDREMLG
jgi:hypothetical protein